MLGRMDSRELSEWLAYYKLEPFGQDRQDAGPAIVAHTIANIHRPADSDPYPLSAFFPRIIDGDDQPDDNQEEHMNPQEQLSMVEMLNAAFGGTDLRGQ